MHMISSLTLSGLSLRERLADPEKRKWLLLRCGVMVEGGDLFDVFNLCSFFCFFFLFLISLQLQLLRLPVSSS